MISELLKSRFDASKDIGVEEQHIMSGYLGQSKASDLPYAKFNACFVPHSHLDLGWLMPYSNYIGSKYDLIT